ncbi:RidA family protein [Streptomyces sp. NBC_01180]|uniref:RidA family protein n=1 Tax=Streptomyces sp. NBC_01180 TaxID=2903763 RepID=UPI00386FDEDF|nr:RidA family protein [Streptomyces sp. NBC_01180]
MATPTLFPHPDGRPRPYSAAALHNGTLWACGQVPVTTDGDTPHDIGDQVRLALDNLETVLTAAGGGLGTLLKVTVYLADLAEFDRYDSAYLGRLADVALPPRTTVQVAGFRGAKRVEIDAVAALVPGP